MDVPASIRFVLRGELLGFEPHPNLLEVNAGWDENSNKFAG